MRSFTTKFFNFLFLIIFLSMCSSPSKEEKLISDYVQTIKGVKTDLKFSLLDYQVLSEVITRDDSIKHIMGEYFGLKYVQNITKIDPESSLSINDIKAIVMDSVISKSNRIIDSNQLKIDSLKSAYKIIEDDNSLSAINEKIYNTEYQKIYTESDSFWSKALSDGERFIDLISDFEKKDSVLVRKVKASYKVINPFLNNAEQEVEKVFLFNENFSRIYSAETTD